MRRRAKVDRNHGEIVDALRKAGCTVQSLATAGDGCPDLLVGFCGTNLLLEVKAPKKNPNALQTDWLRQWQGSAAVVRSAEEAIGYVMENSAK